MNDLKSTVAIWLTKEKTPRQPTTALGAVVSLVIVMVGAMALLRTEVVSFVPLQGKVC